MDRDEINGTSEDVAGDVGDGHGRTHDRGGRGLHVDRRSRGSLARLAAIQGQSEEEKRIPTNTRYCLSREPQPMPPQQYSGAPIPSFVSPSMWQESVASVYEGGLKRQWDYEDGNMNSMSKRPR